MKILDRAVQRVSREVEPDVALWSKAASWYFGQLVGCPYSLHDLHSSVPYADRANALRVAKVRGARIGWSRCRNILCCRGCSCKRVTYHDQRVIPRPRIRVREGVDYLLSCSKL